ncbi:MAG: N-acetylmuramic acid 6-phosphate etherase [Firmicutes bacterium]|nr:N-acetylmuramic acid 6-phosphate etherase [Bacillota bacterium]
MDLDKLLTETRSPYVDLDTLSTREILAVINAEDKTVPLAVEAELDNIAAACELILASFQRGGHLYYVGCGTSGRLGVLDASECPPTFGVEPELVTGIIAGGNPALRTGIEGIEDDPVQGKTDLIAAGVTNKDVVVGIAASGRTPYVIGALTHAREIGAKTVAVACTPNSPIAALADVAITPLVGPEVLTGSTRMKAGTAQKMVLNMLTTTTMIRWGKVYSNLMVDVQPTNSKLIQRAYRIISLATGCDLETAKAAFAASHRRPKTAIVMLLAHCDRQEAEELLARADGFVRDAVALSQNQ